MKNKVTIELSLSGNTLGRIELTSLEYEAIRLCPPGEAMLRLMRKDARLRADPGLILQVVQLIQSGSFRVTEARDGET